MSYPSDEMVEGLMRDFEHDFGGKVPFEDARRMLVLYDELYELFERYGADECDDSFFTFPRLMS